MVRAGGAQWTDCAALSTLARSANHGLTLPGGHLLQTVRSETRSLRGTMLSFAHDGFFRGLTFEVRGGRNAAELHCGRPLD